MTALLRFSISDRPSSLREIYQKSKGLQQKRLNICATLDIRIQKEARRALTMIPLREYLKIKCDDRGLTYKELSGLIGKSPQFFTNLLNGHSVPDPRKDQVYIGIAKGLSIPLIELIDLIERHRNLVNKRYQEVELPPFFPEVQTAVIRKLRDGKKLVHSIKTNGFAFILERIIMLSISVLLKEADKNFRSLLRDLELNPVAPICKEQGTSTMHHDTTVVRAIFMAIMEDKAARRAFSDIVDGKDWIIGSDLRLKAGKHYHIDVQNLVSQLPYPLIKSSDIRLIVGLADEEEERKQIINDGVEALERLPVDQLRKIVFIIQQLRSSAAKTQFVSSELGVLDNLFVEKTSNESGNI